MYRGIDLPEGYKRDLMAASGLPPAKVHDVWWEYRDQAIRVYPSPEIGLFPSGENVILLRITLTHGGTS